MHAARRLTEMQLQTMRGAENDGHENAGHENDGSK